MSIAFTIALACWALFWLIWGIFGMGRAIVSNSNGLFWLHAICTTIQGWCFASFVGMIIDKVKHLS